MSKKLSKMKTRILILHGPNLNLLGEREPEVYGSMSLSQMNKLLRNFAIKQKISLKIFQSNGEGVLIDYLHQYRHWAHGVVINPAAYSHYSYSIRDAIASINIPVVEVHLTNIKKREKFRRISVVAPVCIGQISGLGWKSYMKGIQLLMSSNVKRNPN